MDSLVRSFRDYLGLQSRSQAGIGTDLSDWLEDQLGTDDDVEMTSRVTTVVETMNATGAVMIRRLAYLGAAYGRDYDSSLQLVSVPDLSEGFIVREPGWKSEEDWGDWEVVAPVNDTTSLDSVGDAFESLCDDFGVIMFGIPQSIEIYAGLLTKQSVRAGMLTWARQDTSGNSWTGSGLVADAFDTSHDDPEALRTLAQANIHDDDDFEDLTPEQQELIVNLLVDASMSSTGTP